MHITGIGRGRNNIRPNYAISIWYGARREKLFEGNALHEPKPTRYSRRTFAYQLALQENVNRKRETRMFAAKLSTNNRNAFRAARYGRDTRNLINRRTGSPHRPIIRKTFRSRLYKRLEKFTPTHRHDTFTILKSLSNIVLYIES